MALDLGEGRGARFHCFVDAAFVECVVNNQTSHLFSTASKVSMGRRVIRKPLSIFH
jgi:hypothetical protein